MLAALPYHARANNPNILDPLRAEQFIAQEVDPGAGDETKQAALSLTLPVLPSPDGLTPAVRLHYDASTSNGIVGAGWSLDAFDSVSRHGPLGGGTPSWGAHDVYRTSGEPLERSPHGVGVYLTQHVDGWEYTKLGGGFAWIARREGRTRVFGDDLQAGCGGNGLLAARHVPSCDLVRWYLTRENDEFGNEIQYSYSSTSPTEELRIEQIRYNVSGDDDFRIDFLYEARGDTRMSCRDGRCRLLDSRLSSVRVSTHLNGNDNVVYRYDLDYAEIGPAGQSVLVDVTQRGVDNAGVTTDNDLVLRHFAYSTYYPEPGLPDFPPTLPPNSSEFGSEASILIVNPGASSDELLVPQAAQGLLEFSDDGLDSAKTVTMLQDVNGDALLDLVVLTDVTSGGASDHRIFLNEPLPASSLRFVFSSEYSTALNSFLFGVPLSEFSMVDLNQDGLVDWVRSSPISTDVLLGADDGYDVSRKQNTTSWKKTALEVFADINGDGAPDLVSFGLGLNTPDEWRPNNGGNMGVGPDFFDAPLPISDPVKDGGVYSLGGGTCMAPGSAELPLERELGEITDATPPAFHPTPGPLRNQLAATPRWWLWRNTSHVDVNGDGIADRVINVDWLDESADGERWVENSSCGRTETVLLGDGSGGFVDVGYETGGPSTAHHMHNLASIDASNGTAQYWTPINQIGMTDIDGDGRLDALNRCAGTLYDDLIWALPNAGMSSTTGFLCPALPLPDPLPPGSVPPPSVPLKWVGPLPISGTLSTMVDLNGDGFPDGFRGPNYVSDIGPEASDGTHDTTWPLQDGVVWYPNLRTSHQGWLSSVTLPSGGTISLTWGRSAAYATQNGPVNLPVLLEMNADGGTYTYEYSQGAYGNGQFLGWGKIQTNKPTGSFQVRTYSTSLPLKGRLWTDELYRADGSLFRIKVYVDGAPGQGPGVVPLHHLSHPYEVSIRRICTFELPVDDAPVNANRMAFISVCEEFVDEGDYNLDPLVQDPGNGLTAHDTTGITRSELYEAESQVLHGRSWTILRSAVGWPGLTTTQQEDFRRLFRYMNRLLTQNDVAPSAAHSSLAQTDGPHEAHAAYTDDLASDAVTAIEKTFDEGGEGDYLLDPPDDPMDVGAGGGGTQPPTSYRFYVTEADWSSHRQLAEIRYYRDVSTRSDSRKVTYTYQVPANSYDVHRLAKLEESSITLPFPEIERTVNYATSGPNDYAGSRWQQAIELPREDVAMVDGQVSQSRIFRRTVNSRGQVEITTPPTEDPTQTVFGFCGPTFEGRGDMQRHTTYDTHCRVVATSNEVGLTTEFTYDDLRRVVRRIERAPTPTGEIVTNHGTRYFDDDGAPTTSPDEVLVWEFETGAWGLRRTHRDAWGRETIEEVCEWAEACEPNAPLGSECCDPNAVPSDPDCGFGDSLDNAFTCSPGAFHAHRTTSYNNEGELSSRTDWHDIADAAPPVWTFEYDEFSRGTKITRPDGTEIDTRRDVGWIEHEEVAGTDTRKVRSSVSTVATLVEQWDPAGGVWKQQAREVYDRYKRVSWHEDPSGTTAAAYEYDGYGRLSRIKSPVVEVGECDGSTQQVIAMTDFMYTLEDRREQEQDPDGHQTRFEYDSQGRLQNVRRLEIDAGGAAITNEVLLTRSYDLTGYLYNGSTFYEWLLTEDDGLGNEWKQWSLGWGAPRQLQRPDGTSVEFTYDSRRRLTQVDEAFDGPNSGTRTQMTYDLLDRVLTRSESFVGAAEPTGQWSWAYDRRGQLVSAVDPDGETQHFTYDDRGRPDRVLLGTDANTARILSDVEYDPLGRIDWVNRAGAITKFFYDELGRVERMAEGWEIGQPVGRVETEFAYDAANRVEWVTDGLGFKTRLVRNAAGWITRTERYDAANVQLSDSTTTFDVVGRPVLLTDEEGLETCLAYDFRGRLSELTPPGASGPTTVDYRRGGLSPIDASPLQSDIVTVTSPMGDFVRQFVDGMGRVHMVETPQNIQVGHYDSYGRLVRTDERAAPNPTVPLRIKAYGYHPSSARLALSTDWIADEPAVEAGCLDPNASCPHGRLMRSYTPGGRLATLTDENGLTTTYSYAADGSGLLSAVALQEAIRYEFVYDPNFPLLDTRREGRHEPGQPIADPIEITFQRDRDYRIGSTSRSQPGSRPGYSEGNRYTYDSLGRIELAERLVDGAVESSIATSYDDHGYVSNRQVSYDGHSLAIAMGHQRNGLLQSLTYPSGNVATYNYETDSTRLSNVRLTQTAGPVNQLLYRVNSYDADGRWLDAEIAPGSAARAGIKRFFDTTTHRMRRREIQLGPTGASIDFDEDYTYDPLGHLERIDRTSTNGGLYAVDSDYEYDLRGFVTREAHSSGGAFDYTYDASGNRTSMTEDHGTGPTTTSFVFTDAQGVETDRVQSIVEGGVTLQMLTWDDLGRQTTSSSGDELLYNLHHELVDVKNGTTPIETNVYGPDGQRIARTAAVQTTYYLPAGEGRVYSTLYATGDIEDNVFVGGQVVAKVDQNGQIASVVSGVDGNPLVVDPTGTVQWEPLNAWGLPRDGGSPPASTGLGYHQMQANPSTGLSHAGLRVYDTAIGRFTTADPIGFMGGSTDLYRYAFNNPIDYRDLDGLKPKDKGDEPRYPPFPESDEEVLNDEGLPENCGGTIKPTGLCGDGKKDKDRDGAKSDEGTDTAEDETTQDDVDGGEIAGESGLPETGEGGGGSGTPLLAIIRSQKVAVTAVNPTYGPAEGNEATPQKSPPMDATTQSGGSSTEGTVAPAPPSSPSLDPAPQPTAAKSERAKAIGELPLDLLEELGQWYEENEDQILSFISFAVDFSPAAPLKDGYIAVYGEDPITGDEVSDTERAVAAISAIASVIPGAFLAKAGGKGLAALFRKALNWWESIGSGISRRLETMFGGLFGGIFDRTRRCFVAGTGVLTPRGIEEIERIIAGDVVLAAASTDGSEQPWVEVEDTPAEESGAWAPRGVCDRVTAWAPKWAMPAMVALAACGVEPELPAADEVVQVYDARTGDWSEAVGAELEVGGTWLDDGRLLRWTDDGVEDRGEATVKDLAAADTTWKADAATRAPGTDEWVLVLGEADEAGHWTLGAVEAGERFAFQGRVFETADADGDGLIEVRPTYLVLARVVQTFERAVVDEVVEVEVSFASGETAVITGTEDHPFYVPEVDEYIPMGGLDAGTALRTPEGDTAEVVSVTPRGGGFDVYNIMVDEAHNYFVRAPGFDGPGVLVHNRPDGDDIVEQAVEGGHSMSVRNTDAITPGPHAGESIPARGPDRNFTRAERDEINRIGAETGCHTCGTRDPGTSSGDFVPDHQPPNSMNHDGAPQELYPQCIGCSRKQGGQLSTRP